MKLLKKITILLCFLSLIAFVSCSAEDKSGVKEKDNADGTEITDGGKSGNSGTGGSAGTGGTSETGGTSGTGGGTETIEEGNFPPPAGTYRDDNVWNEWKDEKDDTKVSTVGNTTKIKGMSKRASSGGQGFGFDISKWKKTIKDGKDSKYEAVDIVVEQGYNFTDISIVYYYDSSTLEITLKSNYGNDFLFKGTKQP